MDNLQKSYYLIENLHIADFFSLIKEQGKANELSNSLEKKFLLSKTDGDFFEQLKAFANVVFGNTDKNITTYHHSHQSNAYPIKVSWFGRLIDAVEKGVGRLTKAYFEKKDIDNEIYRDRKKMEISIEKQVLLQELVDKNIVLNHCSDDKINQEIFLKTIGDFNKSKIEDRSEVRKDFVHLKEQENIEAITNYALESINSERESKNFDEKDDSKKIDDDWIFRFFKLAEQVSENEMQMIWGRILAGQVISPNSYSLRTLEILSSMTQQDALVFSKLANFAIKDLDKYPVAYIFHKKHMDEFNKNELGIIYSDLMMMEDIGIISSSKSFITYEYSKSSEIELVLGNVRMKFEIREQAKQQKFPAKAFTRAGTELLSLLHYSPSQEYVKTLTSYIATSGNKVVEIINNTNK